MTKYLKIFLFLVLLPQVLFAQSNIRFEHLSVEQGLSQNHVTCILKDSKGFMWFGTHDGLNRYDGKNFKVYKHDPEDSNSLSNNHVQAIYEDKYGNLWIGTYGGGLDKFELATEEFTHYRHDPILNSISNDFVLSIYEDKSGHLWIGTDNGGINKFDRKKNRWISYQNDPDNPNSISHNIVRAFYEDESGNLWIGTDGGGLNRFDKKTEKFTCYKYDPNDTKSAGHGFILGIIEDENSNLWLATGIGLVRFDRTTETFMRFKPDLNDFTTMGLQTLIKSSTEPGVIWISTHGIYKFDIKNEEFTYYNHDPYDPTSLSSDITVSIYEDDAGLIWVGTADKGLNKYNKAHEKIQHYGKDPTNSNSLSNNLVSAIYQDKAGVLWIGTDGEGLNKFDRESGIFTHYKRRPDNANSLSNNKVYSIMEEKSGILWISTFDGLNRFDTKNQRFMIYKHEPNNSESLSNNLIFSLYKDRSDNLWIGTLGGGLNKLVSGVNETNPIFKHYKNDPENPNSISNNSVICISEDDDGFLWVGTSAGGLNKFDPKTQKFIRYHHDPQNPNSLSNNFVTNILQDKSGVLWIGTLGGGLNRFNPDTESFIHFQEKDGLCNDFICGILEDDHHNLWISTRNGLSKFNTNEVDEKGVALPSAFKSYYGDDGFQGNEFNNTSYFKNRKGELFFGGLNGFNVFHPDSILENRKIPNILVTEFHVFNKPFKLDSSITTINEIIVPYDENFFSFRFAAIDLTIPKKNQYAYKLAGLDADWIYSGNFNFASYTDVDPGEYIFRVKGSNNDGVWNEEGTSLRIIITPPWWKTWWAYTIYTCLLLGLVYFLRRYELNRQNLKHSWELERVEAEKYQEIDRIKSRFFANISHEFRTPLTLIKGPVQQMLSGGFKGNIEKQCKIILRNTNRLMQLINQLLDLSKLESGQMTLRTNPVDVVPLLKGLTHSFESLANQKNITLKFQSCENGITVYVDWDKFEKIIINLLSNAFKFTPEGGKVVVNLSLRGDSSSEAEDTTKQSPHVTTSEIATPRLVRARNDSDKIKSIEISIFNSGPGVAPENLDKIFDRFYQVDDSSVRKQEGSGIGLALTKEFVELHHGIIELSSELDKGTEFTVQLPLGKDHLQPEEINEIPVDRLYEIVDPSKAELSLPPFEGGPGGMFETETIQPSPKNAPMLLIVEDNPDMRDYIRECLKPNYFIKEAENGEIGIQQAIKHSPELIVSDVMMPKMDGIEFCAKIKTNERTSHIPVILLTAKASGESKIEGLETGADDYITKPFDTRELQVRVKNLIEQRRKLRERFKREIYLNPKEITVTSTDEKFLQKASEIVEKKISDPEFSVDDFVKDMSISRTNLYLKLSALTGLSAKEFIRTIRLKRAAHLLRNHYGTISEIAYEVGFNNPSYFAECFHKQFKQLPSRYKSQNID